MPHRCGLSVMQSSKEMSCSAFSRSVVLEAVNFMCLTVHTAVTRNVRIKLCCNLTLKMSQAILFFNLPLRPRPSTAHLAVIIGRGLIQHCVPFDTMGRANSLVSHPSLFFFCPFSSPSLPPSLSRSALSLVLFRPLSPFLTLVPFLLFA